MNNTTFYENKLILLLSKTELIEEEVSTLFKLITTHMDWSRVIGLLKLHRVLANAWVILNRYILCGEYLKFSFSDLKRVAELEYKMQLAISNEQFKYMVKFTSTLEEKGINYALLKGFALSQYAYGDIALRLSGDCDVLIHPKDIRFALNALQEIGYIQGKYNYATHKINPANRKEIITQPLISHEVHPLILLVNEVFINYYQVDVQFSIDLMSNRRTDQIVEEFLQNKQSIEIKGHKFITLSWEDMLIFVSIHFYKEAIYKDQIFDYKDLLLYKINDIYRMATSQQMNINWQIVIDKVKKYSLCKEVYFAFYYVQELFQNSIPQEVLKSLTPENVSYLNQVLDVDNVIFEWKDTILNRVLDFNRPAKIYNKLIRIK